MKYRWKHTFANYAGPWSEPCATLNAAISNGAVAAWNHPDVHSIVIGKVEEPEPEPDHNEENFEGDF